MPEGEADFEYLLGGAASGTLTGHCTATGVAFPEGQPGAISPQAATARLLVYESWVNHTLLLPETGHPIRQEGNASQTVTEYGIQGPRLEVEWPATGMASLLGARTDEEVYGSVPSRFGVDFQASALNWNPAMQGENVDHAYWGEPGPIRSSLVFFPGWGRLVQGTDAQNSAAGDLAVHLREATVSGHDVSLTLPKSEEWSTKLPGSESVTEHQFHGLLFLPSGRIDLPTEARPFCQSMRLDMDGTLRAYQARGTVAALGQNLTFDQRVLELVGRFTLDEAPRGDDREPGESAPVGAAGQGRFRAVGIDFVSVPGSRTDWTEATGLVLAGAAGAGAIWGLWKTASLLFTRLHRDELLDSEGRRRVYDAIAANPGITQRELAAVGPFNPNNAKYHLRVLRRHEQIRAFKLQREWRFFPLDIDPATARRDAWRKTDPNLDRLRALLQPGGVPATHVVATLGPELGLSRSGVWKLINRGLTANLLVKERQGRQVILRIAS